MHLKDRIEIDGDNILGPSKIAGRGRVNSIQILSQHHVHPWCIAGKYKTWTNRAILRAASEACFVRALPTLPPVDLGRCQIRSDSFVLEVGKIYAGNAGRVVL